MHILTLYGRPIWNDVRIHPHSSLDPFSFQFKLNKLVSNNVSKDISFQRYLVLDILTNPDSYTKKKGNILGKSTANLAVYILLFEN